MLASSSSFVFFYLGKAKLSAHNIAFPKYSNTALSFNWIFIIYILLFIAVKMWTAIKACECESLQDLPGTGGVVPCSQKEDKEMRAPPAHNPPSPPNPKRDEDGKKGLTGQRINSTAGLSRTHRQIYTHIPLSTSCCMVWGVSNISSKGQ